MSKLCLLSALGSVPFNGSLMSELSKFSFKTWAFIRKVRWLEKKNQCGFLQLLTCVKSLSDNYDI